MVVSLVVRHIGADYTAAVGKNSPGTPQHNRGISIILPGTILPQLLY